ncbi:MAG: 2-oxoacid:acceptor oxidoreductase family protein [Deltaproteobacteria bacterium]|nr:2-oxoacid:acceptor oxidoreductase family protein [Deltaproteobacteria bacterium]MBW2138205.1 2-oxoacid:acceptor oxidoreductase family protein [Deltaproteobacteria bacterium]
MDRYRIIFSGSGGQGVITASLFLAEAAVLYEGLNAVQSQTYGPEARGGATRADVIISERPIRFPRVNQPNILVSLTQQAYNLFSGAIRPGALLLTDSHFVQQEQKVDARQVSLGMYKAVMEEIGKPVVFNICMLGALLELTAVIKRESLLKVLETRVPQEFQEANNKAFDLGQKLARKYQGTGQRSQNRDRRPVP